MKTGETVSKIFLRGLALVAVTSLLTGCNAYQPTKDVWKGTKNLWNTYVSTPAVVDYEEKGDLSPHILALSTSMMGIDVELGRLERVMLNADRPPTREWISNFFAMFPWVNGFAGVKYDGTILGQEPAQSLKQLDFIPLLYEDPKQGSRALRGDVQPSPLGPEVLLAAPIHDGVDFLGVVAVYFDIRSLMQFSDTPEDLVILTPHALLWPGKYDFAATPLAGVDWATVVSQSSSGTCSNATGSFYYLVRYLGNLPLVFAVPKQGTFPAGDGSLEQGLAFFPQEREKLPPPPLPERSNRGDLANAPSFVPGAADAAAAGELQPGSQDSLLLQQDAAKTQAVQERQLEGEKAPVERPKRRKARPRPTPPVESIPEPAMQPPAMERPSPFGPREAEPQPQSYERPSPFGPRDTGGDSSQSEAAPVAPAAAHADTPADTADSAAPAESSGGTSVQTGNADAEGQGSDTSPSDEATLPGGRPSPFGPR